VIPQRARRKRNTDLVADLERSAFNDNQRAGCDEKTWLSRSSRTDEQATATLNVALANGKRVHVASAFPALCTVHLNALVACVRVLASVRARIGQGNGKLRNTCEGTRVRVSWIEDHKSAWQFPPREEFSTTTSRAGCYLLGDESKRGNFESSSRCERDTLFPPIRQTRVRAGTRIESAASSRGRGIKAGDDDRGT